MKNKKFYSVTLGQLITIWVFGLSAMFFSLIAASNAAEQDSSLFLFLLIIVILFFLIFYTIGWRANRKNMDY